MQRLGLEMGGEGGEGGGWREGKEEGTVVILASDLAAIISGNDLNCEDVLFKNQK